MTKKTENALFGPLAVGFLLGLIVAGTAAVLLLHNREPQRDRAYRVPQTLAKPAASPVAASAGVSSLASAKPLAATPAVTRIASGFDCACGSCTDELDVCNCDKARQERAFIAQQLHNGRTETEVAQALKAKYGGSKS